MPIQASTCFDGLEITINQALVGLMKEHLRLREDLEMTEDTPFDHWLHGQLYTTEFNKY